MHRAKLRNLIGIGFGGATVAIIGSALADSNDCRDAGWGYSGGFEIPLFVPLASVSLGVAVYFLATAPSMRRLFAVPIAALAFFGGGFAIYFLAVMDALYACPP